MESRQDLVTLGSHHKPISGVVALVASFKVWIQLGWIHTESKEPLFLWSVTEKLEQEK